MDLDPQKLRSRGAKLLAAYLKYAETEGQDLGRDRPDEETELNDFEADVKLQLERQLGLSIIGQYGAGGYRIDLAVQHPDKPGLFVLAVECDGATYHSAPTARMRDRLRQQILEARGWRFVRIWSTDWFHHRDEEIARVAAAYREALALQEIDAPPVSATPPPPPVPEPKFRRRSGPPPIGEIRSIAEVSDAQLVRLIAWITEDGRLRDDKELFESVFEHLGFARRGPIIVDRINKAIGNYNRRGSVR
jgi:very-short-patch-repair endonuclease